MVKPRKTPGRKTRRRRRPCGHMLNPHVAAFYDLYNGDKLSTWVMCSQCNHMFKVKGGYW